MYKLTNNNVQKGLNRKSEGLLKKSSGFTLVEVMIVIAIVAIGASVAIPYYRDYVERSRLSEAFSTLSMLTTRMESYYLDNRSYFNEDSGNCGVPSPKGEYFTFECESEGDYYIWTAKASFGDNDYEFQINDEENSMVKKTNVFKSESITKDCWIIHEDGECF